MYLWVGAALLFLAGAMSSGATIAAMDGATNHAVKMSWLGAACIAFGCYCLNQALTQ